MQSNQQLVQHTLQLTKTNVFCRSKEKVKIIDLKFTNSGRILILISSAIIGNEPEVRAYKFKGEPISVTPFHGTRKVTTKEIKWILQLYDRIFRNQPEKKEGIIQELFEGATKNELTLKPNIIADKILTRNRIIITWTGQRIRRY